MIKNVVADPVEAWKMALEGPVFIPGGIAVHVRSVRLPRDF